MRHGVRDLAEGRVSPGPGSVRRLMPASALREDRGVRAEIDGTAVAVFRVEGRVYVIDDTCPHADGSLAEGEVCGAIVTCPLHAWKFDVRTGDHAYTKKIRVRSWPARIVNGHIEVDVPVAGLGEGRAAA